MSVTIKSDGIFENPLGKSAPSVDENSPVSSVSQIRGIDVLNTVNAPAHGSGSKSGLADKIPSKLPFD